MPFVRMLITAVALVFCTASTVTADRGHSRPTPPPPAVHHETSHHTETPHPPDTTHHPETTHHSETTRPSGTAHHQAPRNSRVQSMLPPGMTVQQASRGFRNHGQFVAAVRVSHNLGIPFADLKREMVRNHLSLGQAIQKLRSGRSTPTPTPTPAPTTTQTMPTSTHRD